MTSTDLYLDLLKRAVLNEIYNNGEYSYRLPRSFLRRSLLRLAAQHGEVLAKPQDIPPADREGGRVWPNSSLAHSMIGRRRLDNIQNCIEQILASGIPGDLIETGAWRGGSTIFMRGCLKAMGDSTRTVWVADSFEGLPVPSANFVADKGDIHHTIAELSVSLQEVRSNFARYGLLDDNVKFLKGWFKDTLPSAPIKQLALLRLDGDMFESTMDALNSLYDKVSPGGFVIVDDYNLAPCRQAVHDFRDIHHISEPLIDIDGRGVYWRLS